MCYREVLPLKDGGQVALDWLDPVPDCPDTTPIVVILPGLTGSSQAEYIKGLALAGNRAGARVVVFQNRGISIELKVCYFPYFVGQIFFAMLGYLVVEGQKMF